MTAAATELDTLISDLVTANRILTHEGVCDAYGHISLRHPERPDRYLLSRSRSPELVERDDIMEFELDGTAIDGQGRQPYLERFIHGAIYEVRADVVSVIHNHSISVIPFSVTGVPLRALLHVAGRIGGHIPVWDIRDKFGDTDMLVRNMEQGRDLADALGDNVAALMRGHGCVVTAPSIVEAVLTAVYLHVNASLQMDAIRLGEVTYLSAGEVDAGSQVNNPKVGAERGWEYLKRRAGVHSAIG